MYIKNVTDYDEITSSNYTDYVNITFTNCTNKENNIDIFIPTLLFTKPCGLSFLSLMSLMVYTLIKLLINGESFVPKSFSSMYTYRT